MQEMFSARWVASGRFSWQNKYPMGTVTMVCHILLGVCEVLAEDPVHNITMSCTCIIASIYIVTGSNTVYWVQRSSRILLYRRCDSNMPQCSTKRTQVYFVLQKQRLWTDIMIVQRDWFFLTYVLLAVLLHRLTQWVLCPPTMPGSCRRTTTPTGGEGGGAQVQTEVSSVPTRKWRTF